MAGLMYFGNEEYMTWVPCPAVDMGVVNNNYIAESQYLNGGAGIRRSAIGAKRYSLDWNLTSPYELDTVEQFYQGTWGSGLIHFLDPAAMITNVFPQAWAAPRVALDDGPKLVFDQQPVEAVSTSPVGRPGVGAQYTLDADTVAQVLTIPIPDGYKLVCECLQTGDAYLASSLNGGSYTTVGTGVTLDGSGGGIAKFSLRGTGDVSLFWLTGVIVPAAETPTLRYYSGRGNAGCAFTLFERNVYSAAIGSGLEGATAEMLEVASWL
jgi:hypothetical protein